MQDIVPLLIAFAATLVGIVGNTWDPKRKGIRRLTTTGWFVILLAVASFIYGAWTIKQKNREIADVDRIRQIASAQILEGADYLLRHLVVRPSHPPGSEASVFQVLRNAAYLQDVGKQHLVHTSGVVSDGRGGVGGSFEQPWQLYDFNVSHGEHLLNDAVRKYSHLLEPQTILAIDGVLTDQFFLTRYKFAPKRMYLDLALEEERTGIPSRWGVLGLYYFNAVYEGEAKRPGQYGEYLEFIEAVENLVATACRKEPAKRKAFEDRIIKIMRGA